MDDYAYREDLEHVHDNESDESRHLIKRRRNVGEQELEDGRSRSRKDADDNVARFNMMFFLTGGFFLVELVVGVMSGSLALVSDAFHMASDFVALVVGYYAVVKAQESRSDTHSFGYKRFEAVGALINAAGLMAICFTILVEAVQRVLVEDGGHMKNVQLVIVVAIIGLAINLCGMVIFGGHGHSHGGHGGHGGHDEEESDSHHSHDDHGHGSHDHGHDHGHEHGSHGHGSHDHGSNKHESHDDDDHFNMNVYGVYLHVMGDALGSVAVLISACLIEFTTLPGRHYADPICTFVIVIIITCSTWPLLKSSIRMLLETVPEGVQLEKLKSELLAVKGIEEFHELHVWGIDGTRAMGTCHVIINTNYGTENIMEVLDSVKNAMHKYGVHSSSIQPEFGNVGRNSKSQCYDIVCENKSCLQKTCCDDDTGVKADGGFFVEELSDPESPVRVNVKGEHHNDAHEHKHDDHGHGHSHGGPEREEHGHGHGHGIPKAKSHGDGRGHGEVDTNGHSGGHGHSHSHGEHDSKDDCDHEHDHHSDHSHSKGSGGHSKLEA